MNFRDFFPIFKNKPDLIYLDNGATTQKPDRVVNAIFDYYLRGNSNIKRGIYSLAEETTKLYESAREKVAKFINVDPEEIVFTSGTTEGINFIADSWAKENRSMSKLGSHPSTSSGRAAAHGEPVEPYERFWKKSNLSEGDEIVVSELEHHSNFLPWQRLAKNNNLVLKIAPIKDGKLDYESFEKLLNNKTKLVAVTYQSNVTGEIIDINRIKDLINKYAKNAKLLVDAAQIVAHRKLDVEKIGCDFLVFSAHKMFGPTGVGVLYINKNIEFEPYKVGGGMVFEVSSNSSWLNRPHKYEAGTPPIAEVIGLGAAIDFINENIDFDKLEKYEFELTDYLVRELSKIKNIEFIINPELFKNHVITFNIKNFHAHDVAAYLDKFGICVRAGHHCAQPLHNALGINSSVRVSFAAYNNLDEVKKLVSVIKKLCEKL
ncbi:hypothetical protein A3F66_05515 [candidate division TM6 bacterium RIFCSPHIGHO2_12_FULL_32_22]|nr:MAG: hypothetical protein A3F66_05515 [candidate division TM6 bacterium RIFCSPHIGHO2_12_FULL_32_22]